MWWARQDSNLQPDRYERAQTISNNRKLADFVDFRTRMITSEFSVLGAKLGRLVAGSELRPLRNFTEFGVRTLRTRGHPREGARSGKEESEIDEQLGATRDPRRAHVGAARQGNSREPATNLAQ
jgi:hypothetical protein